MNRSTADTAPRRVAAEQKALAFAEWQHPHNGQQDIAAVAKHDANTNPDTAAQALAQREGRQQEEIGAGAEQCDKMC
ncbi:MAG: hypothetical protein ACR5LF_11275 [Symbiopectobacterium sp.]